MDDAMGKPLSFVAVLWCVGTIVFAAPPDSTDLPQRTKQIRERLSTTREIVDGDDELTVRAIVSIIDEESKRAGNNSLKHRALLELGKHPDSELAIKTLIREIEFGPPQVGGPRGPLKSYTAALTLTKMGSAARVKLLRGLRKPLAEPELHLRAHVLGGMDGDMGEGSDGPEITLHRLRRELKLRKEDPEPPGEKEGKAAVLFNLQRMISILEQPGALSREIPVAGR
jgi:hypothetical protein